MIMAKTYSTTALHYSVIDAMTMVPFTGNPTPVFILDNLESWLSVKSMQLLAREMQQSETCFLRKINSTDPQHYAIRWFTPIKEEPFCGHGVLAAAIALQSTYGKLSYTFVAPSGITTRARIVDPQTTGGVPCGSSTVIMEFPWCPINFVSFPNTVKTHFATALKIKSDQILHLGRNSLMDVVIELDPSLDFSAAGMDVDPVALLDASPPGTRSQILTSSWCREGVDFAKRVFAYGSEDQATGSTYCLLGPYWAQKLGRSNLKAIQVSLRTGSVDLIVKEDDRVVEVISQGVKIMSGEILLPSKSFASLAAQPKL